LGEMANDMDALEHALLAAKDVSDRPSLLILRSHIGYPSPDHTDDHEAHGMAFDAEDVTRTKAVMGIPDEPFWAPAELVEAYRKQAAANGAAVHSAWAHDNAETIASAEWQAAWNCTGLPGWTDVLPTAEQGEKIPTRKAIESAINATLQYLPGLVAGAADLTGNTGTKLKTESAQSKTNPGGRQIYFGVREHAMGASMVGMAAHGGILPVGGTFFVFLDYMRPPVRLAALSKAKVLFVYSHDSVGVGEDGPTHQPVEHLATLRAVPDLQVIRPADGNETVAAFRAAVGHDDGPTVIVLTRQGVPVCTDGSAVERGAGIVADVPDPALVIVATGSEVWVAIDAAKELTAGGIATRVVSLPSWDRFRAQGAEYRVELLPPGVPVLSVEAGSTFGWGDIADASIGIDRFGVSAPGDEVLRRLGINVEHVVETARALVG
jgi:transketolase